MSLPHFFINEPIDGVAGQQIRLVLDEQVMAHLTSLRLKARERIVLVDRPEHGWILTLSASPDKKTRAIEGCLEYEKRSQSCVDLTLVQGISAPDRMDQTIRQVTELGIARIIPFESERSQVRFTESSREKKRERWQRIAISAAEQSAQLKYPIVERPLGLKGVLELLYSYDLQLFFWEEAQTPLSSVVFKHGDGRSLSKAALFIGPEGGFSPDEAEYIKASGAHEVSLGATILRTETAAVVASALVLHMMGALGAR